MNNVKNLFQRFNINGVLPRSNELLKLMSNVSITMEDIKMISELNTRLKYPDVNRDIARLTEKRAKIMNISILTSIISSLSRSNYFDKVFYKNILEIYLSRANESNTIDITTVCHAYSLLPPPPFEVLFKTTGDLLLKNDMISQLSARNSAHLLNSFSRANVQHLQLFKQVLKHIRNLPIGNLEAHHSTIVLNALAKFSIVDRKSIDSILQHMKPSIKHLKSENIANAIHALAKLNHSTPLIKDLSIKILSMLPEIGIRELSNCLWGLSKLKAMDGDYFSKCFEFVEMKLDQAISDDKSAAQIMESLRRIGRDSLPQDLIDKVITRLISPLVDDIGKLSLPVITQISWCLVDLGYVNHEFVRRSFQEFKSATVDTSGTEWAYVKLLARTIAERHPEADYVKLEL